MTRHYYNFFNKNHASEFYTFRELFKIEMNLRDEKWFHRLYISGINDYFKTSFSYKFLYISLKIFCYCYIHIILIIINLLIEINQNDDTT